MTEKSYAEQVAEAKTRIREVTAEETLKMQAADPGVVILDVREPKEWNQLHIPDALFIPLGTLESQVEAAIPRDKKVVIYCARGNRSALAADIMQGMGYADVASMSRGIIGWIDAGGDIEE